MVSNQVKIDIPNIYTKYYYDNKPYQIWKGSRFSAKSWTKALFFILKCRSREYFRLVYARDTQKNVRQSQYQLFIDITKKFGLYNEFEFRVTDMRITHRETGHFMSGGSFEQPDTLRSVADVTDFWAEEPITRTFSIDRESFLDIVGSLRNSYGVVPRFHLTFNPIGKKNFIYEDFFSENKIYDDNDVTVLHTTYLDNPFCPKDRIDFLNNLKRIDINRYYVDALGNWGEPQNNTPWFTALNKDRHVAKSVIEPYHNLPIYVSFDFNIDPMCAIVGQHSQTFNSNSWCHILKSYKIANPKDGNGKIGISVVDALCNQIKKDFPTHIIYATGDSNGRSRNAGYGNNDSPWSMIIRKLKLSPAQMKAPLSNLSHKSSRFNNNYILYNFPKFLINPACTDLIHEMEIAKPIETDIQDKEDNLFKGLASGEYGMNLVDCFRYYNDTFLSPFVKKV